MLTASTQSASERAIVASPSSVRRTRLLARLEEAHDKKLIVVHAPAGFGKTTLLRQYCADRERQDGVGTIWLHLGATAKDPAELLRLIQRSLTENAQKTPADDGADPSAGARRSETTRRGARVVNVSQRDVLEALAQSANGLTLVLDDFEQACHEPVIAILNNLIRYLPAKVQVAIGTRTAPAGLVSSRLIDGEAMVLDAEEVRFGSAETRAFLGDGLGLDKEELDWIHHCTEGWPAALQCFRLCLKGGRFRRSLAFNGNGVTPELINYLATGIIDSLDTSTRELLLAAALPERICPELVEHISNSPCRREDLERIFELGLFLTPVGLDHRWYQFHNLFRQFLLGRLGEDLCPEQLRARHRLTADWYLTNGLEEQAIGHLIEAEDTDAAARLLERHVDGMVNEERLGFITGLIDRLPEKSLRKCPNVQGAAIIAYGFRREFAKANTIIEARRRALEKSKTEVPEEDWGLLNSLQLFLLAAQDRVADMAARAEITMRQLSAKHGFRYAVALNAHAFWLQASSRFEEAANELAEARPIHKGHHSLFGQAYEEGIASTILTAQARITDACTTLQTVLHQIEQTASASAGASVAAYLAEAYYERNAIEAADALLDDYLPVMEQQAIVDPLAIGLLTRARIAILRGEAGEAERIVERLMALGHGHDLPRLVFYGRAELIRQATLAGDMELATRRLDAFFGGREPRMETPLLFHASETEAQTVTYARYLICAERYGEARALIQGEIRKAKLTRRRRRQLKLGLLLAIALDAEGDDAMARRSLLDVVHLGAPGEMVRSILDEGPQIIRLLKELLADLPRSPNRLQGDDLVHYVQLLLKEAGERQQDSDDPPSLGLEDDLHGLASLTEREIEILRLVSNGFSNKDLANRLGVSTNTVKWHLRNVYDKLQIGNRVQAIAVARHFHLID